MAAASTIKIALAGKPNAGKSSLFNLLTGLNQKIGNFPGITVDKRTGTSHLNAEITASIMDLPGIYSLYPRTLDEKIVTEILMDRNNSQYPDCVVLVADATHLKNCLLLLTQLIDLQIPTVLALNMMDLAAQSGQSIDVQALSAALDLPVVMLNARTGQGVAELKTILAGTIKKSSRTIFEPGAEIKPLLAEVQQQFNIEQPYRAYQLLQQTNNLTFLSAEAKNSINTLAKTANFFQHKYQGAETVMRYGFIQDLLNKITLKLSDPEWKKFSYRIDKVLTHKVGGYLIFFAVLFLIFQAIFAWAQVPMDFIDSTFAQLSNRLAAFFPEGPFFDLITQGIVPGIGGIVIFIPQIAILFACISILEESGYMARVVFLMDKLMRKFGLNGKSVVPLISGMACAIPAIMATRTIENWKDRLITIFVTPLMSCSARLPVFTILVALIIPDNKLFGFFNYQGLVLMALYLAGFLAALFSAFVLKFIIQTTERSYLIMEMPTYRKPKWTNVGYTIIEKTKSFVFEAGKVILAISIVLWVLASYGPGEAMNKAHEVVQQQTANETLSAEELEARIAAYQLEHSYAGIIGKTLEPLIKPLGYDWKIGIALVTSFAAREVFVSTVATIYSLGGTEDEQTIKGRLKSEINPATGGPRYTTAVGLSLLAFYTFAMQCMSTLAVVKRETKGWKWPLIQLVYMTVLAYVSAFIIYQSLS
ncbi:MAG: ferrous iron transport protein B [Cyclobacteriaceae bacterium]|nr:ferrous iron transport protein B [Cyclobacteriaceae bacterium]